jgi:hypothetical protein
LGEIYDLPIALLQLNGAYTSKAIATAIIATLQAYRVTLDTLGYFVLNNASNNDTAIAAVAREFRDFNLTQRRLCCSPYTINLIRQALLFGNNKDAYNNAAKHINDKEAFIAAWRKHSALGTLLSVIIYIKILQQYALFTECLEASNNDLPAAAHVKILRLIKLVVTRWNLYYSALKRATYLKGGLNLYIEKHVSCVAYKERRGT